MDGDKRFFLRHGFVDFCAEIFSSFEKESKTENEKKADEIDSFFSSYESCQAYLSDVTLEELQRDAEKIGIDTENLSKREIAKKLYYRINGL